MALEDNVRGTSVDSLLQLEGITKRFGGLTANDAITMGVAPGEVVSMLGENGAGKSTLMKVIYGLVRADAGSVIVDGVALELRSPRDAMAAGIGMVTQEFSLVETMTVAENIALSGVGLGRVDQKRVRDSVLAVMERVGVFLDPDTTIENLSIGERQRVEIIKALYHDCKVLILDEPTAVLTPQDVDALFATIRSLRENNFGVLFVSHKLREVAEISDRVVVLRHGKLVADRLNDEVDAESLAGLMMGSTQAVDENAESAAMGLDLDEADSRHSRVDTGPSDHKPIEKSKVVLDIAQLSLHVAGRDLLDDINLRVHGHEIVGLAGISGNGQSELVEVLSGVSAPTSGTVTIGGQDVTTASVHERLQAGLGRLTEDRRGSTIPSMSVEQNLVIEDLADFRRMLMLDRGATRRHAEEMIERFAIKARPTDAIGNLSGGNVQKVLLARALARQPTALVAAQPTRGLDIGTYGYVHEQLQDLCSGGAGVLVISEDLDELRSLCDRIAVIFRGRLVGELSIEEVTSERLGIMMTGEQVPA